MHKTNGYKLSEEKKKNCKVYLIYITKHAKDGGPFLKHLAIIQIMWIMVSTAEQNTNL